MPMVRVGFRQYGPEGDKSDAMGTFSGFTEALDEYIGLHTLRIQKPFSQTQLKDLEGNSVVMTPEMLKSLPTALNKGKGQTVLSEWEKL